MKPLYQKMKKLALLGSALLLLPSLALATDFDDYGDPVNGISADIEMPTVTAGWFVAADYFPEGTLELIDGAFEAEGRMIAVNGTSVFLQRTYGSSKWDLVGTLSSSLVMDPSFIHVSPDGSQIALGVGYNKPMLIIPTSALSIQNPPVLDTLSSVTSFDNVNYYDGDWVDNRYFVINGGQWPGDDCDEPYYNDPDCVFQSGVGVVDTQAPDPANHTGVLVITNIPGASSDVDVDSNGNLLTGLGWAVGPPNRTGELKVWPATEWNPTGTPATPLELDYEANTRIVADNILSVASLGEDKEGNLHIGGGDAFGSGGPDENGYIALIRAGVVNDIASGTIPGPVLDGNKVNDPVAYPDYKFLAPDPCQDDSATNVRADTWGRGLAVMWNPSGNGSGGCAGTPGSAADYWEVGITPMMTIYYSTINAPDTDGDGIPNTADNAYLTANAGQEDTDGDGYGNIVDADFDNDFSVGLADFKLFKEHYGSTDPDTDMDSSGTVDLLDFKLFKGLYGEDAPYY